MLTAQRTFVHERADASTACDCRFVSMDIARGVDGQLAGLPQRLDVNRCDQGLGRALQS